MRERQTVREVMSEMDAAETLYLKWQTYLVEAIAGMVGRQVTRAFQTLVKKRLEADGLKGYVSYEDDYTYNIRLSGDEAGLTYRVDVSLGFHSQNCTRPVYTSEMRAKHIKGVQIAAERCNLRRALLASDAPERLDATIDQAWAALATAMAALKTNPDGSKLRDLLPKGR